MHFTQEDYIKIENWLHRNSVKDTEFQEALPFTGKEIVTVVQDGHNRKVNIQEFINQLYKHGVEDFLNVTNTYRANNITLKEAIRLIPAEARKEGQVITFLNTDGNWEIYQFIGKLNQWNNPTLWNNPFDWEKLIVDSILPDEEDLTKSASDAKGNAYLSLKDRKYEPDKYSGLGRKILRRRVVEIEDPIYSTQEKNLLLQADFAEDNTVYVVRYDFTLNGQDITLPDNSYIEYEGGSISDGNIIDRAGGLNKVVLKKNIINGKNILTQEMLSKPNTIYEIKYDFDLNEKNIEILNNCILHFSGGSLNNGTIILHENNIIDGTVRLNNLILNGSYSNNIHADWFENLNECINNTQVLFKSIVLSAREYYIDKPIYIKEGTILKGYNKDEWTSKYSTSIKLGDTFNGDSVIFLGEKDGNHNIRISNININAKENVNGITAPYKIYGLELDNIYVYNAEKSFSFYTFWTSIINRCNSYNSKYGFYLEGQTTTSTNINNCVVFGGDTAFYINIALNGTSFTNCAIDGSKIGFDIKYGSNVTIENLTVEQFYTSAIRVDNSITKLYVNNLTIGANYLSNSHILDIRNVSKAIFVNCAMPSVYMPSDQSYYCVNIEDAVDASSIIFVSCSLYDYRSPSFKKAVHINSGVEGLKYRGLTRFIPQNLEYQYGQDSATKEITSDIVNLIPVGGQRVLRANPIFITSAAEGSLITFINKGEYTISFMPESTYYGATGFIGSTTVLHPNDSITVYYKENKFYAVDNNSQLIKEPRPLLNNNELGKDAYDTNLKRPTWWDGEDWRDAEGFILRNKIGSGENIPTNLNYYDRGFHFFNDESKIPIWWASDKWVNANGYDINYKKGGTTEERPDIPTGYHIGYQFIDETINKPIWWTGSKWIDATGVDV